MTREVLEEAGLRTRAVKLIGVYDSRRRGAAQRFHIYRMFFQCEPIEADEPGPDALDEREKHASELETDAVEYFTLENLPPLVPSVSPEMVVRLFEHARDPGLPTDFD